MPAGWKEKGFEALGVTPRYSSAFGLILREGRFLSDVDLSGRRLVCVIGDEVARALGTGGRTGEIVRFGSRAFRIAGVLAPKEWKSRAGSYTLAGSKTLVLVGAPVAGLPFIPQANGDLLLDVGQQKYVFKKQ